MSSVMSGTINGFNRRKADARLVAAAPGLYKAAKRLVASRAFHSTDRALVDAKALDALAAALVRAGVQETLDEEAAEGR